MKTNEENSGGDLRLTLKEWVRRGTFSQQELATALRIALQSHGAPVYLGTHQGRRCYLTSEPGRVHA